MPTEFIKGVGYRLSASGRSLILSYWSLGKPGETLTRRQILQSAYVMSSEFDAHKDEASRYTRLVRITPSTPDALVDDVAYKFTDDEGSEHWLAGRFKLAPVAEYASVENAKLRDEREGLGSVYFRGDQRFLQLEARSGFNSAIVCTSSDARRSERSYRHSQFGRRLLKIHGASEFALKIAESAGAIRFSIRDVVYSDIKVVIGDSGLPEALAKNLERPDIDMLAFMADNHLDDLIVGSEASAVFTKPCGFWRERERRFQFVFPADISAPIYGHNASLAEHLEVVV